MPTTWTRQRSSRPRRHAHLVHAPRTNEDGGMGMEAGIVMSSATEDAASLSSRPTLDDFGGRSDALGG